MFDQFIHFISIFRLFKSSWSEIFKEIKFNSDRARMHQNIAFFNLFNDFLNEKRINFMIIETWWYHDFIHDSFVIIINSLSHCVKWRSFYHCCHVLYSKADRWKWCISFETIRIQCERDLTLTFSLWWFVRFDDIDDHLRRHAIDDSLSSPRIHAEGELKQATSGIWHV